MNAGSPNNEEAMTPAPDASEAPFLQVLAHRSMLKAYLLVIVRDPHLAADGFRAGATFAGRAAQGRRQLAAVLHVWSRGEGALNRGYRRPIYLVMFSSPSAMVLNPEQILLALSRIHAEESHTKVAKTAKEKHLSGENLPSPSGALLKTATSSLLSRPWRTWCVASFPLTESFQLSVLPTGALIDSTLHAAKADTICSDQR